MAYRIVDWLARGPARFGSPRRSAAVLAALTLASCSDGDSDSRRDVELQFDARIGSQRVACGEPLPAVGQNQRTAALMDLRFYVSDIQLIDAKGKKVALQLPDDGVWQYSDVALLDFEDKTGDCRNGTPQTNAVVRGKAPPGKYTGLSFRVGVPSTLNHTDPSKMRAPLGQSAMHWSWQQGFLYARIDLAMDDTPADREGAFELHLGSAQCTSDNGSYDCERENSPAVTLSDFDPARDKVVLDLAALLAKTTVAHRPLTPASDMMSDEPPQTAGCASGGEDPDCMPMFTALGLTYPSGTLSDAVQTAFLARARDDDDEGRSNPPDAGGPEVSEPGAPTYNLKLPAGFPAPAIPADNPLSADKIELGRHLFYDKRLSGNQTQACASCHQQEKAFADDRPVGLGSTGVSHVRGAMSLANIAYSTTLTWANPNMKELEKQARVPMFGTEPVELGLEGNGEQLVERLRPVDKYKELFKLAYPNDVDPFSIDNVLKAIASFERSLISGNSAYDRYKAGDKSAISESAKRGEQLFFDPDPGGSAVECFHCHGGFTFSDQLTHANQPSGEEPFHNTGLYNLDVYGSYPAGNQGVYETTMDNHDRGRFKAPTLRNVAVTAPYMHDGSIATLEDVIAHYARGGRNVETGPNIGDGKLNRNKSEFIHGFPGLSAQSRADLIEFLKSLTDDEFLKNPAYSDPWK